MKKKKRFSLLKFLLIVLCIVLIAASAAINVLFTMSSVPKVGDRYIYVVGADNPLGTDVTEGAALIAKDASAVNLAVGDIVVCYPADAPDQLTLRSINGFVESESGERRYYTRDAVHEDSTDSIPKSSVAAVATGYPESLELGRFITFTRSVRGIVLELIVPCILLVILLIAKIASAKSRREEEESFYQYEGSSDEKSGTKKKGKEETGSKAAAAPLFDNTDSIQTTDEFERKKQSIAENFSQKKVNPDSPYQKEKERTMQFKAQRASGNTGNLTAAPSAAAAPSSVNSAGHVSGPVSDAVREEALRKTAEAEKTGVYSLRRTGAHEAVPDTGAVTDNTGIISTGQAAEIAAATPVSPAAAAAPIPDIPTPDQKVRPVEETPAPAPKRSDSPDISDIISKSDRNRRKKNTDAMSVDDLLRIIEEEKKKL